MSYKCWCVVGFLWWSGVACGVSEAELNHMEVSQLSWSDVVNQTENEDGLMKQDRHIWQDEVLNLSFEYLSDWTVDRFERDLYDQPDEVAFFLIRPKGSTVKNQIESQQAPELGIAVYHLSGSMLYSLNPVPEVDLNLSPLVWFGPNVFFQADTSGMTQETSYIYRSQGFQFQFILKSVPASLIESAELVLGSFNFQGQSGL